MPLTNNRIFAKQKKKLDSSFELVNTTFIAEFQFGIDNTGSHLMALIVVEKLNISRIFRDVGAMGPTCPSPAFLFNGVYGASSVDPPIRHESNSR